MGRFDYINRTYGLSLRRGSRIEYSGDKSGPRLGSVTSAAGQYINVRFDDTGSTAGPFHPTWSMRHLEEEPHP